MMILARALRPPLCASLVLTSACSLIYQDDQRGGPDASPPTDLPCDAWDGARDDFSSDALSWATISDPEGLASIDQALTITPVETTAAYANLESEEFDFRGRSILLRVLTLVRRRAKTCEATFGIWESGDPATIVGFYTSDGEVTAGSAVKLEFTPDTRWWRLQERDGRVGFYFSRDGLDWVQHHEAAAPAFADRAHLLIDGGCWDLETDIGQWTFDDLNLAPGC